VGRARFYEFDGCRIDVHRRLLLKNGAAVAIKPKALETLLVLIEHRDRVVEKDELMRAVWPDTVVEEANLTQNVFVIRKALGEAPGEQRYIATIARRGYRFVADVRDVMTPEAEAEPRVPDAHPGPPLPRPAPPGSGARLGLGILAILLVAGALIAAFAWNRFHAVETIGPIRAIAVLPFRNLSADPEQEYFAAGMTEAVITDLRAISALRVASRQSVTKYKDSTRSLPDIARELGIDAVVDGSVVRSGGRLRLTVQLVHAPTDSVLWTSNYDRDLGDVLTLQGELARAVAETVHVAITEEEHASFTGRPTVNPEAYDLFLRARHLWDLRSEEALRKSLDYYQQAITRDPSFAPAHAGLALSLGPMVYLGFIPPTDIGARVRAAAQKALALDPGLVDGHVALAAHTVMFTWDWNGGELAWKRILQRTPNDATARLWYGFLLERLGRLDEALVERRRAVAADPLSLTNNAALADTLRLKGAYDEAIGQYRRTLDLSPRFPNARWGIAWAHFEQGKREQGVAELAASTPLDGAARGVAGLAHVYGRVGRTAEAVRLLESLTRRAQTVYVPPLYFAYIHSGLGQNDKAFGRLEEAYRERNPNLVGIGVDVMLKPLHADPRFRELVRRMNLPWQGAPVKTKP
jgi:TolB-like protein/DNA-binding winged helix-turn-helix (wHTH) protein